MPPAPHLPPRTRDMIRKEIWHMLKWVFLIVILSSLAGTSAALLVVNSWYPTATLGNTTMVYGRGRERVMAPDANIVREWRERVVRVYDKSQTFPGSSLSSSGGASLSVYSESAELGQAAILSSSGYAVMLAPGGLPPNRRQLVGIDSDGRTHTVDKLLADKEHNLWYLKLSGSGETGSEFRATTVFGDIDSLELGDSLWGLNSEWRQVTVGELAILSAPPYRASEPAVAFGLVGSELPGRMIVSPRGELMGFAASDNRLVPSWLMASAMPSILTSGALPAETIEWRGYFVAAVSDESGASEPRAGNQTQTTWREVSGFYVSDARSPGLAAKVKVGDVITKVNGQKVTKANLARLLSSAPSQFQLTALRDGSEVEVEATRK